MDSNVREHLVNVHTGLIATFTRHYEDAAHRKMEAAAEMEVFAEAIEKQKDLLRKYGVDV